MISWIEKLKQITTARQKRERELISALFSWATPAELQGRLLMLADAQRAQQRHRNSTGRG